MPTYVRLRRLRTGSYFDVCTLTADLYLRRGGVEIVTRVPPYTASCPRPGKPLTDLAGRPTKPRRARQPGHSKESRP